MGIQVNGERFGGVEFRSCSPMLIGIINILQGMSVVYNIHNIYDSLARVESKTTANALEYPIATLRG